MTTLTHRPTDAQEMMREDAEGMRNRLALTRVLIWAEREAQALGRPEVAASLHEAISRLHARP